MTGDAVVIDEARKLGIALPYEFCIRRDTRLYLEPNLFEWLDKYPPPPSTAPTAWERLEVEDL